MITIPDFSREQVFNVLRKFPKRTIVQFTVEVAEDVFPIVRHNRVLVRTALDLVHQWLRDPSIPKAQLARSTGFGSYAANCAWYVCGLTFCEDFVTASVASSAISSAFNALSANAWQQAHAEDKVSLYKQPANKYRQFAINLHAKADTTSSTLRNLLDQAILTRDKTMFGPIWDVAADLDLIPSGMTLAETEKHAMFFFLMLDQATLVSKSTT